VQRDAAAAGERRVWRSRFSIFSGVQLGSDVVGTFCGLAAWSVKKVAATAFLSFCGVPTIGTHPWSWPAWMEKGRGFLRRKRIGFGRIWLRI
jgi:hypothetical protein